MVGIYALAVITLVQHAQAIGDFTFVYDPRSPVRQARIVSHPH
jgi:hypothetical protein